jgi:cytochrome P450
VKETPKMTRSYLDLKDQDPFGYYRERLDSGDTVYWDEGMRAWMVLDHENSARVHREESTFGHPYWDLPGAVKVQGGPRQVMMLHGAEHLRLHRFLMRYFSPMRAAQYRARYVEPLVTRMLDRIAPAGAGDLDELFAEHLPAYVICTLLGVSIDDEELLERCKVWNDDIMKWSETFGEDPDILREALSSAEHLAEVLLPIIRDRREHPQDDFISDLWREGPTLLDNWDEYDVLAQARVLLFAGSETTAHLIRNAIYHLLEHQPLRAELVAHPERVEAYVEEILRYYGVIHFRIRAASQDTDLGGCPVHAGDRVHAVLSAANRDAKRFDHPDEFAMDRSNSRDHLAFGLGPRMCIGANLARAEAVEAVRSLLVRLPDLRWDDDRPKAQLLGHMPRSYRPLNARWATDA